jgi:hypothetical protein
LVLVGNRHSNFLLFHKLAEAAAVFVAVLMLATAWYTYPHSRDSFLLFLGCGYFWVGMLDLAHALAYKGMNIFPTLSADLATQLWVAARYLEAFILLGAPLNLNRQSAPGRCLSIRLVFALLGGAIARRPLPTAYVRRRRVDVFKVASEYVIIAILVCALFYVDRRAGALKRGTFEKDDRRHRAHLSCGALFHAYVGIYGLLNVRRAHPQTVVLLDHLLRDHPHDSRKPYARLEEQVAEQTRPCGRAKAPAARNRRRRSR